jgi:hypothetical protein
MRKWREEPTPDSFSEYLTNLRIPHDHYGNQVSLESEGWTTRYRWDRETPVVEAYGEVTGFDPSTPLEIRQLIQNSAYRSMSGSERSVVAPGNIVPTPDGLNFIDYGYFKPADHDDMLQATRAMSQRRDLFVEGFWTEAKRQLELGEPVKIKTRYD